LIFPVKILKNIFINLAACLDRGGMLRDKLLEYLYVFGKFYFPDKQDKDIISLSTVIIDRLKTTPQNLTEVIREYIMTTIDSFSTTNVHQAATMTTRDEKKKANAILSRFAKEGFIEHTGKLGWYRRVQNDCDKIDFINAETETLDIWLPFGLNKLVEIMPGNIIVVAGEPDSGKTALLLNTIMGNQRTLETHYFNSEMGNSELKKRLSNFSDFPLENWKFKAWERSDNFADVIKPGKGKLNIIDFLEIHKEFYEIGGKLAEIHKKLDGAVAVIAIQKNRGVDLGLGGGRALEKPRLYLSVSPGNIKIIKAKNWKTSQNPNGLQRKFKIVAGCRLSTGGDWYRE
jgi:hypothetical protein